MLINVNAFSRRRLRRWQAEYRHKLLQVAWSWCGDRDTAEDLVQEACMRGLKNLSDLRDHRRQEVWMIRIMHRVWLDHLKSAATRLSDPLPQEDLLQDQDSDPESFRIQVEDVEKVRRAVSRLPKAQRQVLTLVDLAEFSYAECASALEIPVGTVMSRLNRARTLLKKYLSVETTGTVVSLRRKL